MRYEYKVVPAPQKGAKAKGVKTPEGRFANAVEQVLNQMGQEGWEYQRAELLPSEERTGLTGSAVNWRNVLVFRRAVETVADMPAEEDAPQVRPVPGPEEVLGSDDTPSAPAPIAAEANDPPLTLKPSDEAETPEGETEKT